jgi:hypothetical protein
LARQAGTLLGENNTELLVEPGLNAEEIEALETEGLIGRALANLVAM